MNDIEYLSKKLGFSLEEFFQLMKTPNRSHSEFKTEESQKKMYNFIITTLGKIRRLF